MTLGKGVTACFRLVLIYPDALVQDSLVSGAAHHSAKLPTFVNISSIFPGSFVTRRSAARTVRCTRTNDPNRTYFRLKLESIYDCIPTLLRISRKEKENVPQQEKN